MKIKKKDFNLNTISLVCIFVTTFFLPLKTSISNAGLIGLIILTLLSFIFNGFQMKGKLSFFFIFSPMVFFLPLLWGWLYSPLQADAFKEMSKYVFLGLTPLLLFRKDVSAQSFRKYACYGILSGALLSGIILLTINFYRFGQSNYPLHWLLNYHFTSFDFLAPLGDMHPIYMGMYFSMALGVLLFTELKMRKILKTLIFSIIVLTILFLASRIIYAVVVLMIFLYLLQTLSFKSFAVLITLLLAVGCVAFYSLQNTYLYQKTIQGTLWDLQENVGTYNTDKSNPVDSRRSRWQVALELIKDKPILGYGGGTENEVLLEKYKTYQMKDSIDREYNAHSQFLGFFLRFGIIGFSLLLVYFFRNGITAFKYKNLLFLSFLTILFWTFMVENILDRNMGINFVALFGTLFYAEFLAKETKEKLG